MFECLCGFVSELRARFAPCVAFFKNGLTFPVEGLISGAYREDLAVLIVFVIEIISCFVRLSFSRSKAIKTFSVLGGFLRGQIPGRFIFCLFHRRFAGGPRLPEEAEGNGVRRRQGPPGIPGSAGLHRPGLHRADQPPRDGPGRADPPSDDPHQSSPGTNPRGASQNDDGELPPRSEKRQDTNQKTSFVCKTYGAETLRGRVSGFVRHQCFYDVPNTIQVTFLSSRCSVVGLL